MARQSVIVENASLLDLDGCSNALSKALVGHTDHGSPSNTGCLEQDSLHLGRVDVGPAAEDQCVPPVSDEESTMGVEVSDVPRVQHPIPYRLGRRFRFPQVAEHGSVQISPLTGSVGRGR